jgi:chemotaxis protein CheD
MQEILNVHIAEVKIAKNGELLKAILGSCVGIGMMWKEERICGLAHCLLPESPSPTFAIGGRFVDQAIRSLLAMMKVQPGDMNKVETLIVGGGNMTNPGVADSSKLVGAHNFQVALREARKYGLRVVHCDSGGEQGRKIFIDSSNFTYRVENIPRLIEVA